MLHESQLHLLLLINVKVSFQRIVNLCNILFRNISCSNEFSFPRFFLVNNRLHQIVASIVTGSLIITFCRCDKNSSTSSSSFIQETTLSIVKSK